MAMAQSSGFPGSKRLSMTLFLASALCVYTAIFFITRSPRGMSGGPTVGIAALFDLVVTVPVLFYWLCIRPGFSRWTVMPAIVLAGLRGATLLLPPTAQIVLPGLKWMALPLELWIIGAVWQRFRRQKGSGTGDTVGRIRESCAALFPNAWIAGLVASEIEVFYYGLCSWRAKLRCPEGYRAFPLLEASGYGMFSTMVILGVVCEGIPVHVIVQRWRPAAAWILTALDLYGIVWALALRRSVQLQPVCVGDGRVLLRAGILWRMEVGLDQIAECRRVVPGNAPAKSRGYLRLTVINEPQWLLELREPLAAFGIGGYRRKVWRVGVAVENPGDLGKALGSGSRL